MLPSPKFLDSTLNLKFGSTPGLFNIIIFYYLTSVYKLSHVAWWFKYINDKSWVLHLQSSSLMTSKSKHPVYGCESWTVKKVEHQKIDAFELWCCRRFLRVPWTAGRSNQSILKEISPGCSLEGLMLKLKFQYFGHLMGRVDSLEKTMMLGGIGGRRRRGWQRMKWLDGITDSIDMIWVNSWGWWWTGRPGLLRFTGSQRGGHDWATELNWTWHF